MASFTCEPRRVVVVGGGIAALEAVLALHALAGSRLRITLMAPEVEFTVRPQDVTRPFACGLGAGVDLDRFMGEHGGRFRRTVALSVDPELRTVHCATGRDEPYDTLIVAIGASARPAFQRALTFGADSLALNGFLAHLTQGFFRSVAFIIPNGTSWPLPLYELALLTADEVWSMASDDVELHFISAEPAPLGLFGAEASAAMGELLSAADITWHHAAAVQVHSDHVELEAKERLDADRVVALPALGGPRFKGLPSDAHGFVPVDGHGRVAGISDVYAVGDAADTIVKQGGMACYQADAVAEHVAEAAGAPVRAASCAPTMRGRLLTGHRDRFPAGQTMTVAAVAARPLWWPPMMASGRYLAPYLEEQGLLAPSPDASGDEGVDVELPLR